MSGLEVHGAVAATVQLAGLCYQSEQRLAKYFTGDRNLINTIHAECLSLSHTIDQFTTKFQGGSLEDTQATTVLRDSLLRSLGISTDGTNEQNFLGSCGILGHLKMILKTVFR